MNEEKNLLEEKPKAEGMVEGKPEEKANPLAILSYLGILFLVPLLVAKDDEFVKFHVKQGITLFIAEIITVIISMIPLIGWLISLIGWICWLILIILGIINVLQGKKSPLPVIGKFAENWKI